MLMRACSADPDDDVASLAASALFAKVSRQDELEADHLAVAYLAAAGIDPRGLSTFLATLLRDQPADGADTTAWFRTHPLESERLAHLDSEIRRLQASRSVPQVDAPDFHRMQERLRSLRPR
jgi:predicted Zn-dependent protease